MLEDVVRLSDSNVAPHPAAHMYNMCCLTGTSLALLPVLLLAALRAAFARRGPRIPSTARQELTVLEAHWPQSRVRLAPPRTPRA